MKRLFSVIISLFTVTIPKKLGYEKIKKAAPPQEPAPRSEPLLDYKAKGFGGIENVEKNVIPADYPELNPVGLRPVEEWEPPFWLNQAAFVFGGLVALTLALSGCLNSILSRFQPH